MSTDDEGWDWEAAARRAGATRDRRFNCGAATLAHRRALVWRRADGAVEALSGADLATRAGRTATVLARAGVRRGDRVAGLLGRTPDAFAVPLAVWRLGAVYVPLFVGFRQDALRVRLDDSGATCVVTDPDNRASLDGLEEGRTVLAAGTAVRDGDLPLERLRDEAVGAAAVGDTSLDDPATLMYTSGTSGRPKGCVIPHRAPIVLWPYVERCLALEPDDLLFSSADTGWSFGLYTTGISPMTLGRSRLLYEGGFDPASWWRAVRDLGVSHLAGAPTGFRQLAAAGVEAMGGAVALRAATAGGEALDPDTIGWFQRHVGVTIHDSYGLTELGMLVANLRPPGAGGLAPGSMGRPLPGFRVRLLDGDGRDVAPGEEGQIAVRDDGWFLSSTYWGREPEWQARLRDGWWVTEDRARRDEQGRYWYVGRSDDVIVTAGYNVGPAEVEGALLEHPLVIEAACVAEADQRKGNVVAAHVVLAGAAPADLLQELRALVGERVGWHAAPRRLHVREELPKTESGKIRRAALRAAAPTTEPVAQAEAAPENRS